MGKLIATAHIDINAPADKIWKVLVKPQFINQWDDMPDDYDYRKDLKPGSEIVWRQSDDKFTRLTVIEMEQDKSFRLSVYKSGWEANMKPEDITYHYVLKEQPGGMKLLVSIGDFSLLPNGDKYYAAAQEFANTAVEKIRSLVLNEG